MMTTRTDDKSGFAQDIDPLTLARARRGDVGAHGQIYRTYSRACYTLALRVVGNTAAAEDIVQDVFLKMMDAIRHFRGDAPFGSWLKRMTVNAAIDQLRSQRHFDPDDPERLFANVAENVAGTPDDSHDAMTLLQRLPARARLILVLHELEGYTHKELAELFGQTESYSKSILSRSLKRLQEWLDATKPVVELQPWPTRS
ncbi:RNA polymerase sigma factor [Tahibacter amnicola]|uniref:Sigma-70 family RNA polymerase sigma factor n=1 Tax=Tahibacter amnicola TaxID=2976241 RepID=A0ABY6BFN2_9GAMM|nr:sigma-70 family RNA polymerase sigma factor [Tahibacter amnicola]UXI68416.1 sigma-70 family RNA polymerase sigma factor [Tahibacter amnicola]